MRKANRRRGFMLLTGNPGTGRNNLTEAQRRFGKMMDSQIIFWGFGWALRDLGVIGTGRRGGGE
jgi:hypothetical protein